MDITLLLLKCALLSVIKLTRGDPHGNNGNGFNWRSQISCRVAPRDDQSRTPQSGETSSRVCNRVGSQSPRDGNQTSCCTQAVQLAMIAESRQSLTSMVQHELNNLRHTIIALSAKFDDFFTRLLESSKRKLYDTFVATYKEMFQQNSDIFVELFSDLYRYQREQLLNVNLHDSVDKFFTKLMQRMFVLYNSNHTFSENYLSCMTEHMDTLKPFGEVPKKVSIQIQRAFAAFRTFIQGLDVGRDVITVIVKQKFSRACHDEVTNLLYCPYCRGLPAMRPCIGYCLRVLDGCLAEGDGLNRIWNLYIVEMLKIVNRLAGAFNIESVLNEIDYNLSDAIMNFQSNLTYIKEQIFHGCGRSKSESGPSIRALGNPTDPVSRRPTVKGVGADRAQPEGNADPQSLLIQLLLEAEGKLDTLGKAWVTFPETLCENLASNPFNETQCWNGVDPQNTRQAENESLYSGFLTDSGRARTIISDASVTRLRVIITRLQRAYQGLSVDVFKPDDDDEDDDDEGSAGFSGSGIEQVNNEDITFTSLEDDVTHDDVIVLSDNNVNRAQSASNVVKSVHIVNVIICSLFVLILIHDSDR